MNSLTVQLCRILFAQLASIQSRKGSCWGPFVWSFFFFFLCQYGFFPDSYNSPPPITHGCLSLHLGPVFGLYVHQLLQPSVE